MSSFSVTRQMIVAFRPIIKHCRASGNKHISIIPKKLLDTYNFLISLDVQISSNRARLLHRSSRLQSAEGDKNTEEVLQDSPEITELKNSVKELEAASVEWKSKHDDILDKYRRSIAESDNMRKRLTKQIEEAKIFGIQGFGKDLLEVADVLDKAVGMKDQSADDLHQGLQMTQAQLNQVFKRHGLEPINPIDEKFDPNKHEALFQVPVPDKDVNTVIDVQKVGYSLHGRTIRPALVGVSKK